MKAAVYTITAAALLAAVAMLPDAAHALHADEVGQRDWYEPLVGLVDIAAFHRPSPNIKQVYLSSREGVLAAVGTAAGPGDLRWRHVLSSSDRAVCLLPRSDELLVVVTAKGQVYHINPASGQFIKSASSFAAGNTGVEVTPDLEVYSCFLGTNSVSAAYTVDTAHTQIHQASIPLQSRHSTASTPIVRTLPGPVKVAQFTMNGSLLWVLAKDGSVFAAAGSEQKLEPVATGVAAFGAVSPGSDEVLVQRSDNGQNAVLQGTTLNPVPPCASHCHYSLAGPGVVVTVSRATPATAAVSAGEFSFAIDDEDTLSPDVVTATIVKGKSATRLTLLIRNHNRDLSLVSASSPSEGAVMWRRPEGLSFPVAVRIADHAMVNPAHARTAEAADSFGFNYQGYVLTSFGTLYVVPTARSSNNRPRRLANIERVVAKAADVSCSMKYTKFVRLNVDDGRAIVTAIYGGNAAVIVEVSASTGELLQTTVVPNWDLSLGHVLVDKEGASFVTPSEADLPATEVYGVDAAGFTEGRVTGLFVDRDGHTSRTWSSQFTHHPIIAHTTAHNHLSIRTSENLRKFPNTSSKEKITEVRKKYPTANVLVVAYQSSTIIDDEPTTTLIVTAIDIVTGSVLASTSHPGASGPVHLLIVEHTVLYHFFSEEKQRYLFAVWEMFESELSALPVNEASHTTIGQVITSLMPSRPRLVSSFAQRPPTVAVQVLQFPPGEIGALGVTTSVSGSASKQVIFATTEGHVYAVDLRAILFGGQEGVPNKPEEPRSTFLFTPSQSILSHGHKVHHATIVATSPTELESSSHVLVTGLDLFYVRVSNGKAFDLLNDDFNHNQIMMLCGAFAAVTLGARWYSHRKSVRQQWA